VSAQVAVRFGAPLPGRPPPHRPASREFPAVAVVDRLERSTETVAVDLIAWLDGEVDFYWLDAQADALGERGLVPVAVAGEPAARLELLTRCQRWLGRRNRHSAWPWFDQLLRFHRSLHDRQRPLVRADHNHALDTWQWALRLEPDAGAAVQVAALFHDIERLRSEADARVEHLAGEYDAFKRRHAEDGARMLAELLAGAPVPPRVAARAAELVGSGDRPPDPDQPGGAGDADRTLLEDADCLSFFSLNSPGFLDYYGEGHTARKIAWTLRRLSLRACASLPAIRLRPDVARLMTFAVAA